MVNLCIGSAQFGMHYGIANRKGQPSLSEVEKIVKFALKNNIQFFDTAKDYGNSEIVLGKVFSKLKTASNFKVITKLPPDFRYINTDCLEKLIHTSIENLKVKYLWGLLLHRPKIRGNWDSFIKSIDNIKSKGIINNFGVSIYEPKDALRFVKEPYIDVIQVPFNILDRRFIDNRFFELAKRNEKTIFVRSIYLQGLLLMSNEDLYKKEMDWVRKYLNRICQKIVCLGYDRKRFALKLISQAFPESFIITGVDNKSQIEENLSIIQSCNIPDTIIHNWWKNIPSLPKKILNPALW